MRLTDAAIARLRPRTREYTVWDNHLAGLGVRVRPTDGASYVLLVNAGGSSRRVSLGPMSWKSVAEVRRECHVRKADPDAASGPKRVAPLFRDFVHRFPNTVERTTDKPLSTAAPESLSLFDLWQR